VKRTHITLLVATLAALVAMGGLLLLMTRLSAPETAPAPITPVAGSDRATLTRPPEAITSQAESGGEVPEPATPTPTPETPPAERVLDETVVATVGDVPITRAAWQTDMVMSRLAGQTIPSSEETLDRLINEILLLRGADLEHASVAPTEIEARITGLEAGWGLTDAEVVSALQEASLTRQSLMDRVARLILVERAREILSAGNLDLGAWLAQVRQATEVGVYQSLESAPGEDQGPALTLVESSPAKTLVPSEAATLPSTSPSDLPTAPQPGAIAPDFALTTLDGQTVRVSDLRGRPVLVNFWATWCPPCRAELPALQSAYERYGDQVTFWGVDVKESRDRVADFVPEFGLTLPILLDGDGSVSDHLYSVRGIPTTLFLSPDGVVNARHVGPLTEADIDRYLAPLLDEGSSQYAGLAGREDDLSLAEPDEVPGKPAPGFTLDSAQGVPVALSDYQGESNVVLVFYRGQT
jgi:cytochrome c biogenesis protein CcmG/thiol:disulfide interchange protein DsbE